MVVVVVSEFEWSWFFNSWRSLGDNFFNSSVLSLQKWKWKSFSVRVCVCVGLWHLWLGVELTCNSRYFRRMNYLARRHIALFCSKSMAVKHEHRARALTSSETHHSPKITQIVYQTFNKWLLFTVQFYTLVYSMLSSGMPDNCETRVINSSFAVTIETKWFNESCSGWNVGNQIDSLFIVSSLYGPNDICGGFHRRIKMVTASGSITCCAGSSNSCTIICKWRDHKWQSNAIVRITAQHKFTCKFCIKMTSSPNFWSSK